MDACYDLVGPECLASPVVLSVPHAGRDYPPALFAALRVAPPTLVVLEDRHVDAVAVAARGAETLIVQRRARAWIDLNRGEDERDPAVDTGAPARPRAAPSAKLRSGLGLVPRRGGAAGDLWRRRFAGDEIDARIARDHRPYHARLAALLAAARARFGVAVLLDIHSMPPLGSGADDARIVVGDRFGHAAARRFVARIEAEAAGEGWRAAINVPYSGGHILDRHGRPGDGVHAVQLEIDRRLYLDAALDRPGPGFARTAAFVRRVVDALANEALGTAMPVAAE